MSRKKRGISNRNIIILAIVLFIAAEVYYIANFGDETIEYTSGDAYSQSAANFTVPSDASVYTDFMSPNGIHIFQNFIPTRKGMKSIAIRVENAQIDEMKGNLVINIRDKKNTILFEQIIRASNIEDWHYVEISTEELSLEKDVEYILEVYVTSDESTYPYRLFLTGKSVEENTRLYYDESEIEGQLDTVYNYSYTQRRKDWQGIILVIIMYIVFVLFCY